MFATLVVGQVLTEIGINIALHSITIIQVPLDEDRFLDDDQLNWTVSVTALAALSGCFLSAPAAPRLGVRHLLAVTQPVYALASLLVSFGGSFVWVLLGRVLMMMMLGAAEATVLGYVTEVVPPARRALFTACLSTMGFVSSSVALLVAPYIQWRTMFLIAGFGPSAICLVGLSFIPNSAKWLLSQGHSEEEARRVIVHFRGSHYNTDGEVARIYESLHNQTHEDHGAPTRQRRLLFRRDTLIPLMLTGFQLFLFIWTGGMAVSGITSYILAPVRLDLSTYHSALLPTAFAALFLIPGSLIVERVGRLPLLRFSGSLSALGCIAFTIYFVVSPEIQEKIGSLVLLGAALTQLAHACIISPITFIYVSELLPNKTRTMAANISLAFMYTNMFVMFKLYPLLRDSMGFGGTFAMHACISLLQVIFASCCLPETRGLHLEDIQRIFQERESRSDTRPKGGCEKIVSQGFDNPAMHV